MKERLAVEPTAESVATAAAPEWVPAVDARLTRAGTWILLVADLFFFLAFFFAYFYLRALNNNDSWQAPGITHPTIGIGAVIVLLMIVTAGLYAAAVRGMGPLRGVLWLGFVVGVVAIGLQVYEFQHLGFDPQQGGGYPSVFVGLKGSLMVQFAGALIWMLSHIAQSRPMGDFELRRDTAATFSNFLYFLAGIALITFLILYLL